METFPRQAWHQSAAGLVHDPGHLALARVLLAQARPGPALALLDRLYAAAAAQDRTGSLIETGRGGRGHAAAGRRGEGCGGCAG